MTFNIFDIQKRLRSLHNPRLAQEHLCALIKQHGPRSKEAAQLIALQKQLTTRAVKQINRWDRRRA